MAEVIGPNYWGRTNEGVAKIDIGTRIVVKAIPATMIGKLKFIKEVPDSELIVNDTPHAADLREQGKTEAADKMMAEEKEKAATKPRRGRPKKAATEAQTS